MMFSNSPEDELDFINDQFFRYKYTVDGLVRGVNAVLKTAYGIALLKNELPMGPLATISLEGKAPADFASEIPNP